MNELLETIKENNLKEIEKMQNILPETKKTMIQYVNKFYVLPPIMKMTDYNNKIYIKLMEDALEDDLPIAEEDINEQFKNVQWDVIKN